MSSEYDRIKQLLSDAGIVLSDGGISDAEISAYCSQIERLSAFYASIIDMCFLLNQDGIDAYLKLLNIDKNDMEQEDLVDEIIFRLSQKPQPFTSSEYRQTYLKYVSTGTGMIHSNDIKFFSVAGKDLKKLAKFIKGYMYPFTLPICNTSGLTFDEWDAVGLNFHQLDDIQLPFGIIDTLRSEAIEQYKQNA